MPGSNPLAMLFGGGGSGTSGNPMASMMGGGSSSGGSMNPMSMLGPLGNMLQQDPLMSMMGKVDPVMGMMSGQGTGVMGK